MFFNGSHSVEAVGLRRSNGVGRLAF